VSTKLYIYFLPPFLDQHYSISYQLSGRRVFHHNEYSRAKHDTTAACQQGKVEQVYMYNKCKCGHFWPLLV